MEMCPSRLFPSVLSVFLASLVLIAAGCVSYDNPGDCGCGDPPAPTCADATSRRTFGVGECVDGQCVYPHTDEDCAEGACIDGRCQSGCERPHHSFDCAEVSDFQCGIAPRCEDGTIVVDWHEHVFCEGMEELVYFHCEHTCPMGCEEGTIADWPGSGQQLVADHCFESCEQILIDNGGAAPAVYPPRWSDSGGAARRYADQRTYFILDYELDLDAYRFEPHPVTATPEIEHVGGNQVLVVEPGLTEDTIQAAADAFFAQQSALFATAGISKEHARTTCSGSWCRAVQQQDYCGLAVVADDPIYDGSLRLRVDVDTGGLLDASSATVPMIPIPSVPHLVQDWVRASLVGLVLEYWCADGIHTVEVTEATAFTFEPDPIVFVRAAADGEDALEIRTAHRLRIQPDDFLSWTAIVDAFDGTLLKVEPDFICD